MMKYLIVCIHPRDGATVIRETDDMTEAIHLCNHYNWVDPTSRYTIYTEWEG